MVKASFAGLMSIESPKSIAKKRGKAIQDIAKIRNS